MSFTIAERIGYQLSVLQKHTALVVLLEMGLIETAIMYWDHAICI